MNYIDHIKELIGKRDFRELTTLLNDIRNNKYPAKDSIEILDFLTSNEVKHYLPSGYSLDESFVSDLKDLKEDVINNSVELAEEQQAVQVDNVETSEISIDDRNRELHSIIDSVAPVNGLVEEQELQEQQEQMQQQIEEEEQQKIEEQQQIEAQQVVEEQEVAPTNVVESSEIVNEQPTNDTIAKEEPINETSDNLEFNNKLARAGLTIKETAMNRGYPRVTFEINNLSKPFIDNMMLYIYNNPKPGLGFELTKLGENQEEFFTVNLDARTRTPEEIAQGFENLKNTIENIVDNTNKERDYEQMMPDNLKNMKEQITNDAKDLPKDQNYRIGYNSSNGQDNFYLIAGSEQQAIFLTEELGYKSRNYIGDGVVEIETNNKNMDGTKLERNSEDIQYMNEENYSQVNMIEHQKVKTLGQRPVFRQNSGANAAFLDFKTVVLIIFLVIAVMIVVYLMG